MTQPKRSFYLRLFLPGELLPPRAVLLTSTRSKLLRPSPSQQPKWIEVVSIAKFYCSSCKRLDVVTVDLDFLYGVVQLLLQTPFLVSQTQQEKSVLDSGMNRVENSNVGYIRCQWQKANGVNSLKDRFSNASMPAVCI
ncbi:hypothetical protein H5410_015387 [Solanum commersonii]|uniref:Uncharacterized protein n=1 Tax=Solanum commersonii TaxID=4109 RepID=A0A9J5ZTY2_SOLCO|nr:hypothetical protein H5410_015387 [Solanum commersonii]